MFFRQKIIMGVRLVRDGEARERTGKLKELQEQADSVRGELDRAFRFRPEGAKSYFGDIDVEESARAFGLFAVARRYSKPELEREIQYLRRPDAATCMFLGDVSNYDYAVFVRGVNDLTQVILGEQISCGEYMAEHVRRLGSLEGFYREFNRISPELIGALGRHIMEKKADSEGNETEVDERKFGLNPNPEYDPQLAGYMYACRLVDSGKEIPYHEIFHAKDKREMWDIVKRITGP
jgi:hypothetical protein